MYSEAKVVYLDAFCFDQIKTKFDLFLECRSRDQNLPRQKYSISLRKPE